MKKSTFNKKTLASIFSLATSALLFSAMAETYVVIGKPAKVFDEPNPTYVTLNKNNKEVTPSPGMAFKLIENKAGWSMIEYSPGLRGYISDLVKAAGCVKPKPGTYSVKNKPSDKLKAENNGAAWTASVGGNTFNGKDFNNVIVFFDSKNRPSYSLVDFGNGPIVMSYDNSVTGFF